MKTELVQGYPTQGTDLPALYGHEDGTVLMVKARTNDNQLTGICIVPGGGTPVGEERHWNPACFRRLSVGAVVKITQE